MKFARKKSGYFIFASAALLLVLLAQPAPAATDDWVGPKPNTLWSNPNNWSLGAPPSGPQEASLTSATTKTAFFDPPNSSFKDLTVDATGGGTFTLSMPGNTLSVSFTETIGLNGKGQVVQSGGTNKNENLVLGMNSGSSGTYSLSNGSVHTSAQHIGDNGTGLFTQSGGTNTVIGFLSLGTSAGGVGTYNLSGGGQLQAPNETIGNSGTGTFNQSGGNNNVVSDLSLGGPGGTGTYNLNGGNLTALDEYIGQYGTGTFTQNAPSTNIVSDTLNLGVYNGSGTYTMKGGYLQVKTEAVGDQGTGTFTQKGGTHQVISQLILGNAPTGNGTFTLLAGGLSAGNEDIGGFGTGQFIQSGGTNTVANDLVLATDTAASSGAYTLNAGQLQAHRELIGNDGTGVFTQNGGTNTAGNDLTLGANSISNGTYNLVKGNLQAKSETIGNNGTGTFNQTGGTHTVTTSLDVGPFGGGTGSGTYNLQGGTLSAGLISINNPGDTFNVKNTTTTVTGPVNNLGTVKTTNANVTWNGTFVNFGAYISDPSTQTFNQDLVTGPLGYLVGGSQDLFVLKNDFVNQSNQNLQWNTVLSTLKFVTGTDNIHNLDVVGVDNSFHGQANNFTWGTLNLTGQKLVLHDSNGGGGALYAEAVIGAAFNGTTLTNISEADPNLNIYYNAHLAANAYLHGLTYNIPGGGQLIAHTPVPPSVLLLGSGLLGLGAMGWRRRKKEKV